MIRLTYLLSLPNGGIKSPRVQCPRPKGAAKQEKLDESGLYVVGGLACQANLTNPTSCCLFCPSKRSYCSPRRLPRQKVIMEYRMKLDTKDHTRWAQAQSRKLPCQGRDFLDDDAECIRGPACFMPFPVNLCWQSLSGPYVQWIDDHSQPVIHFFSLRSPRRREVKALAVLL